MVRQNLVLPYLSQKWYGSCVPAVPAAPPMSLPRRGNDPVTSPLNPPPLILAIIIIQPLGYTNPVESRDHHPTALFDTRHLNNGTIFLHRDLCVFIVPLLGHKRLLHHLDMILNPLLLLCRGVFHSRLNTHLFSKRFPLQPSLIHCFFGF